MKNLANESFIRDHLLKCNDHPYFDEFSILTHWNKKHLLELKEKFLIKPEKPILNEIISSTTVLHIFDKI